MTMPAAAPTDLTSPSSPAEAAQCRRWFWMFVLGHALVWTLLPFFTQPNAPLDVIEIVYWGHEWELGYIKHPPLPSYVSELARVIGGASSWGIYLMAQVSLGIAFWAIWRLSAELRLSPRMSLLSVLLLEGCVFYNVVTPEFNHGVCLYAPWAMAVYWLYRAFQTQQLRFWVGTGVCLGLGLLTKYNTIMLVGPMLLFTALHPQARPAWRTWGPYLTILAALVVFSPHLYWAATGGFSGLEYAMKRTQSSASSLSRFTNPLEFLAGQLFLLIPLLLAALPLTGWRWRLRAVEAGDKFGRDFLAVMCLGPVACYLITSLLLKVHLRTPYGSPLWLFVGVLMLTWLKIEQHRQAWNRAAVRSLVAAALMVALGVGHNVAGPYLVGKGSRVHFPGKQLAAHVTDAWSQKFDQPLSVVAGEWWLAGNVSYYAKDRPSVYCGGYLIESIELIPQYSPWTSDQDLQQRGGVILWNARRHGAELPAELRQRFPMAENQAAFQLEWQTGANLQPVEVGMAMIPPASRPIEVVADPSTIKLR